MRIGWLDCASGVSGDMLLGALADAGGLGDLPQVVDSLAGLDVTVTLDRVRRGALAALGATVTASGRQPTRTLADVLAILDRAAVEPPVRQRAVAVFRRLALAEAAVHGVDADSVHFHEVGAVDAIVDVLGACLGLHALGLDQLVVSPIALGGGRAGSEHGPVPVPGPAVLALLAGSGLTSYGGPVDVELATPTGVAVLAEWAHRSGPMPPLQVATTGVGAGGRDLAEHANVLRLVVGEADAGATGEPAEDASWQVLAANVDDLDPRLWPAVLSQLLEIGAADAWLTPILMKKGRPAHTVSALCPPAAVMPAVRVLVTQTSTIGVRSHPVGKHELERDWVTVAVAGGQVRVKTARYEGAVVNIVPEFDDVAAVAAATGRAAKLVLAEASAAALAALAEQAETVSR